MSRLRATKTVTLSDDADDDDHIEMHAIKTPQTMKHSPSDVSPQKADVSSVMVVHPLPKNGPSSPGKKTHQQALQEREELGTIRKLAKRVVETNWFGGSILFVILLNTTLIALQTEKGLEQRLGWYFSAVDNLFLGIYVFELVLKLYVYRRSFVQSNWNNFDAIIVLLSFVDFIQFLIFSFSFLNPRIFRLLRVLRAAKVIRAFRVLRTISFLKSLQVIVNTILKSIPAMGSIIFVLFLVMYIFAIIGRTLYNEVYPERFGDLGLAVFSLFQLITLDNWFTFMDEVGDREPTILIYLLIFIILETFVFINLFIAVIVNNLQLSKVSTKKKNRMEDMFAFRRKKKEEEEAEKKEREKLEEEESLQAKAKRIVENEIESYYPGADVSFRKKQLMSYYFMCMASLENNLDMGSNQSRVLDELVDLIPNKSQFG